MIKVRAHWDDVYRSKPDTEVSWYQSSPGLSLALIEAGAPSLSAAIIDIGGGASRLVDALLADGYSDLTVLDVSGLALERSKARLGEDADKVSWIAADITHWRPNRTWDVWHDRAVFHFLTDCKAQDAYIAALKRGTKPGSAVVISTFAPTGPERCSGLPVQRYSPETLAARLGPDFSLSEAASETHRTPAGGAQDFAYATLRRR